MVELTFIALITPPLEWEANAFYYILNEGYADAYLVDSGGTPKKIGNTAMINEIIQGAMNRTIVVNNISSRNALELNQNAIVLVLDASADEQVTVGSATYIYNKITEQWTIIGSYETLVNTIVGVEFNIETGDLELIRQSSNRLTVNLDGRYRRSKKISDIVNAITTTIFVASINTTNGCFIDYCLKERNNKRVGRLVVAWNENAIEVTEYSSPEIGTIAAAISFDLIGSNAICQITSSINNLSVEFLYTEI